jgi:DNA-binding MarR family transcriptional regulator
MAQNEAFTDEGGRFPAPHNATLLIRKLLELSAEYTARIGQSLNVNETDFRAMEALMENGSMSAGALAKAVGVSPGAATTMIDRLVAVGHVSREQNQKDRRSVQVIPNPESVDSAWGALAPIIAMSEETLNSMSPESQAAVVDYLKAMISAFSTEEF